MAFSAAASLGPLIRRKEAELQNASDLRLSSLEEGLKDVVRSLSARPSRWGPVPTRRRAALLYHRAASWHTSASGTTSFGMTFSTT
jgi:hypothetical protein